MAKRKCFECGGVAEEMHHIIPQIKGSTKTIPLCRVCHGTDRMSIGYLTKLGVYGSNKNQIN